MNKASASSRFSSATIGGCPVFPANNIWNDDISPLPLSANSANYVASIGLNGHVHPDFGSGLYNGEPIGIPYVVVPPSQTSVPVSFQYAGESDPGPYPIPANAPIEGGSQSTGDRHVLVVESGTCKLYETFASYPQKNGSWQAGSGAVWNLNSNALRPATWTSADAAGLPILPGLVSYNEVASGAINHALRFTVAQTQDSFLWPARHAASSSRNTNVPPMGLRLRLKASVNISSFSRINQIILTAMKRYGMFVADNGSSWYISGMPDNRWNNSDLHTLSSIPGSDFEAVNESSLEMNASSGQVQGVPTPIPSPTAIVSPTPLPISTLPPLIVNTSKTGERTVYATTPNSSKSGNSNILWPIVGGGIALLLGITGAMLLRRRR
ncbi:MAG: hypothetical protein ABI234_18665, partial [Ktedonobacteraceae bacterium]